MGSNWRNKFTPDEVLHNFERAVEDYSEIHRLHPFNDLEALVERLGEVRTYWLLVFHASMLRKFVAPGDDVALKKVAEAVGDLMAGTRAIGAESLTESLSKAVSSPFEFGELLHQVQGRQAIVSGALVEQILYGWHLHGDAEKRDASDGLSRASAIAALHDWCMEVGRLVDAMSEWAIVARMARDDAAESPG